MNSSYDLLDVRPIPGRPSRARVIKPTTIRLVRDWLERLGTPRALAVWLLFSNGEHQQLLDLPDVDPEDTFHRGVHWFATDYQATRLLVKADFLYTAIDKASVAKQKEVLAEDLCRSTNKFFTQGSSELYALRDSLAYRKIKRLIEEILGDEPPYDLPDPGWTSGRNTVSKGVEVSAVDKFAARIECTPASAGLVLKAVQQSPLWGQAALDADGPCTLLLAGMHLVEGNVLTTVPKNSKTDRVICYEPSGNIWVQKQYGNYIRERLKAFGCDLGDQTFNMSLAIRGSITGFYSTIDLSSASDTLATEVVYELLPFKWACLLDKIRSKATNVDGFIRRNEKFSSMGNGFTFELESLIFFSIAKAFSSYVSVYGDDIIVPSNRASSVISALEKFGFRTNLDKTFTEGTFRESCGCDALLGRVVTPIYIRHQRQGWSVSVHNQLWWNYFHRGCVTREDWAFLVAWRIEEFPLGPAGFGDGHYFSNRDEASPSRARDQVEGWWYHTFTRLYRDRYTLGWSVRKRNFSGRLAVGALCAGLSDKPIRSPSQVLKDNRKFVFKRTRALANVWPEVLLV